MYNTYQPGTVKIINALFESEVRDNMLGPQLLAGCRADLVSCFQPGLYKKMEGKVSGEVAKYAGAV
jgi:hypothetical protein